MSFLNGDRISRLKKVVIHPGEYYASTKEVLISTLLGSCVAACLFDPVNRVMGMNHFLLSAELYKRNGTGFLAPSARYGVQAMELLINRMYKLGAERKHIKAKAFGGATLQGFNGGDQTQKSIGKENLKFVKEFLCNENIFLVSEDLGGTRGRTIYFDSTDYSVYVRKHHPVKTVDLLKDEIKYREKIKKEQKERKSDISLWN